MIPKIHFKIYNSTGTADWLLDQTQTVTSTASNWLTPTSSGTLPTYVVPVNMPLPVTGWLEDDDPQWRTMTHRDGRIVIPDGVERQIKLPDDTAIFVEKNGSFRIEDKDSKVIYRANRVREFNSYLNASDKLEDFIRYCGGEGVRRGEMLDLPIKLFIAWLVIEAARADGDTAPDVPLLPQIDKITKPHCAKCGRFISRRKAERKISYCRTQCFEAALEAA